MRRDALLRARIHFNSAGASLMPDPVFEATVGHLRLKREVGGYEAFERATGALARFYDALAELLGARHDEHPQRVRSSSRPPAPENP